MNTIEIIKIAVQSGAAVGTADFRSIENLERFFHAAYAAGAAAEKEACAQVCDDLPFLTAEQCATAIRMRGETK